MKNRKKRLYTHFPLAAAPILLSVLLYASPTLSATATGSAAANPNNDIYQRTITIKNDFPFTIYPVIQVSASTCDSGNTGVLRVLVNTETKDNGVGPDQQVTVNLPKELAKSPTTDPKTGRVAIKGCWYDAGRIYIFAANVTQFEKQMVALDKNNATMQTQFDTPIKTIPCDNGYCVMGSAKASYAADAPAQLAEYTFDSDNGGSDNNPNKGIPMADIDISYVDDVYLPLAASVDNHGATGYMGTAIDLNTFIARMSAFVGAETESSQTRWPYYAAYQPENWKNNVFGNLLPPQFGQSGTDIMPHFPAGYNIINNSLGQPYSTLYRIPDNKQPPTLNIGYLITGLTLDKGVPRNPVMQQYVDRWMTWINQDPCADLDALKWPDHITDTFNKANFCSKFKDNIAFIWNHFTNDPQDGFNGKSGVYENPKYNGKNSLAFYADCGLYNIDFPDRPPPNDEKIKNACIIQHIVGYNSKILGGELPGRVQAALRGVAYDPKDGNQQYQFDPFLLFAMPYDSLFNLDPFTRFIHNESDGIGAVAYSFSIDDKYGNYRDAASGFTINAGGTSALLNKTPYDPYQQYKVSWGYRPGFSNNWKSASVCGAPISISTPGNQSIAINSGMPCDIIFTDGNDKKVVLKMFVTPHNVTDQYTGATVTVPGLRTGALPPPPPKDPPKPITSLLLAEDLAYCKKQSSPELQGVCDQVTLSATMAVDPLARDVVYMGLSFEDMPRVNINLPPAP